MDAWKPLESTEATINFAIGPNCPVRCAGCYNHFGETAVRGGLVSGNEIVDFAAAAVRKGVSQTTISGGDPLFHPEIIPAIIGLKDLGLKVKLDTVGTSFIEEPTIVYKGRGTAKKIEVNEIAPHIDLINIPLDGASQETISNFRRGRANLFAETRHIAGLLKNSGVTFGFNTVANATNISELPQILTIAEELGASEWQIFEYDSSGPNPSNKKSSLKLNQGDFNSATRDLKSAEPGLKINAKSIETRSGAYFLIDDSGLAWKPAGDGQRSIMGHISTDREQVLSALQVHIAEISS